MGGQIYGDPQPEQTSNRKQILLTGLGIILLFLVLDLLDWIGGGGIFSVTSALDAARQKAPLIDVDGAGLRLPFVILCSLAVTAFGLQVNFDPKRKLPQFLFMLSIIGGGFVLDGIFGPRIVTHLMTGYGYDRCTARDHAEGHGKSRVWFSNYVRNRQDCPGLRITILPQPATPPADPRSELPRPAQSIGPATAWFTQDDYPADAISQNAAGVTAVRFTIDTGGRIEDCTTVSSSGSQVLDDTTCAVLGANGRYWPARDATGKAIPQMGAFRIRWQLPPDNPAG